MSGLDDLKLRNSLFLVALVSVGVVFQRYAIRSVSL